MLFFLVLGVLALLMRFWGECRADVATARERMTWPTTTVKATLQDVALRSRRIDRPPSVYGEYVFEFGGREHKTERYEYITGPREECQRKADSLKAEGKTIDLLVQYNPADPTEVDTEIVEGTPNCTPWVGGFLVLFSGILLLLLRGYYRLLFR